MAEAKVDDTLHGDISSTLSDQDALMLAKKLSLMSPSEEFKIMKKISLMSQEEQKKFIDETFLKAETRNDKNFAKILQKQYDLESFKVKEDLAKDAEIALKLEKEFRELELIQDEQEKADRDLAVEVSLKEGGPLMCTEIENNGVPFEMVVSKKSKKKRKSSSKDSK